MIDIHHLGQIIVYLLSLMGTMSILWFVAWDKVFFKPNRTLAIVLYFLCSIALAYLVGSFVLALIDFR